MVIPPDASDLNDVSMVQGQTQGAAETDHMPLQQRDRISEDSDTGIGRQKRPRDRDSADLIVAPATPPANDNLNSVVEAAVRPENSGGGQDNPTSDLSQEQIDEIIFVREEEKLARDVYLTLGETWETLIFDNIARSEQRHVDAVGRLIERYGLQDPIISDDVGAFANPVLQQLYDDLVSDREINLDYLGLDLVVEGGATSQLAAFKVGAFIEEFDILDIQHAVTNESDNDVERVYENLLRGSRNHLRSFVGQIEATGASYVPVLMTGTDPVTGEDLDALYLEIVSGDQETRNGGRRGERRTQGAAVNIQATPRATASAHDEFFAGYGHRRGGRRI
jgi:hypothetical protein